ncbi:MAG: hypothetical protein ATN36_08595 [Epulopiscium sp. Nele67-Bin005]|nr:MAG: hypothetical protein ATN36_08595 [Epulopiscium sp. Nele67-Bin005]
MDTINKKPIIGIPVNVNVVHSTYDAKETYYINNEYTKVLQMLGASPVLLPPATCKTIITEQVNMCDGILLAGGDDIFPILHDEEPLPYLGPYNQDLDTYHLTLAQQTIFAQKPILGICRGFQILNIIYGGSVYQDIEYYPRSAILHSQTGRRSDFCHHVYMIEGTQLYNLIGPKMLTNSFHHQVISTVAQGLVVSATTKDGIIEGLENPHYPFLMGVQWHPEIMALHDTNMHPLFTAFINACK